MYVYISVSNYEIYVIGAIWLYTVYRLAHPAS